MNVERPRVRDAGKLGFASKILGEGMARMHTLESLVISSFLRCLSTWDVEAALEEGLRGVDRVQEHGLADLRGHSKRSGRHQYSRYVEEPTFSALAQAMGPRIECQ